MALTQEVATLGQAQGSNQTQVLGLYSAATAEPEPGPWEGGPGCPDARHEGLPGLGGSGLGVQLGTSWTLG